MKPAIHIARTRAGKALLTPAVSLALGLGVLIGTAGTAGAEADPRASCLGVGSSELGLEQAMDDTALAIVSFHRNGGPPPGRILSGFASGPHAGSSEACFPPQPDNPPHPAK